MLCLVFRSGAPTCVLDFHVPPLRFKVQSSAISHPFWTFSCLPSASRSNPPLFLAPFGLPPASPLPQGLILRYFSLLLDFRASPHYLKVQSAALSRSFWTFSCLPSTSKSILPLLLAPFGLPHISPPLQSPILHQPIPPSKAPAISATSESGTRTYLPSGTNHFPIGLSAPALTASTANFFPATQKNIIAASIAPSGQM